MPLTIETYDRRYLPAIVDLYNQQASAERYIAPLTPELFLKLVEPKPYFDPKGFFVAVEDGDVVGWCHACVAHSTEIWMDPKPTHASIEMLVYKPQDLHVGLALVEAAVNWLRPTGHDAIQAINCAYGYAFYRGLCIGGERLCPTTLPHVHLALSLSGFEVSAYGSVKAAKLESPAKILQAKVEVEYQDVPLTMSHETIRQSWVGFEPRVINAVRDGQTVGVIGYVLLPYHAPKLGSPCVNIYMMHVNDSQRRQGIGGALVSRVFARGYELGARFATVGTEMDNLAAHQAYHKMGMLVHCLVLDRRLDLNAPARNKAH